MAVAIGADSQRDQRDYEQAWQWLAAGRLVEGAQLLGAIAGRTGDAALRSQCFYNLGEVLEKLGRSDEAYQVWYRQAHKAPELRQPFDTTARLRVMRMFEQQALRLAPPDFPPQIQIEITNRCNLRCIMCTRNQMTRNLGDMSFDTFRKIADEWCVEPFVGLRIYFLGEPLLHPELERMIAYADSVTSDRPSAGAFGIQTNGMLLTRDRARSLLAAGLRNFAVSLDGLAGDLERIRRGASYPVVEKNICDLIELGRDMGIEDLVVDITKLSDDPAGDEVRRFREVWEPRVRHVLVSGINKVRGNAYLSADGAIRQIDDACQPATPVYCGTGQRLLIHWNGDFGFCCSDVNGELKLGNIHDRTIRQVWRSPEIEHIRAKILAADYAGLAPCEVCTAGGCRSGG